MMFSSHGMATPIDVVKTKIQANPGKYNSGMVGAARKIMSQEGLGFLYAGIGVCISACRESWHS